MNKENKHIVFLFTIILALIGCQTQTNKKLCEADSLLETNLDSAKEIVLSIHPKSLHNVADSAYYVLLKSIITYKSYEKQPTSVLNFPVQFYEKEQNYPLLQKAYFYRGEVNYDNKGKLETSLLDFKRAENLYNVVKDSFLVRRIYSSMATIYFKSKNYNKHLAYEKRAIALAKVLHDYDLLGCCYSGLAIAYRALGHKQNESLYIDSILYNVKYIIDGDSKSTVYSNLGNFYVDTDINKANIFYQKALSYDSNNDMAYFGLLKIAVRKKDKANAFNLWNRLKDTNDDELKEEIYTLFKDEAKKNGDIKTAYLYSNKLDSLNYRVKSQTITYRVDSLQHSFQYDIEKSNMAKQNTNLLHTCFVSGIVLLIVFFVILHKRKKKSKEQKKNLDKMIAESNIVKCTLEEKQRAFNELSEKLVHKEYEFKLVSKEYNKYLDNIKQGLQIMQFVCYEKDYVLSEYQDRKKFFLCYKLIDSDFVSKIEPYTTLQEQIFCSLIRLNFSKEQLMFTLSLSNDSFRKSKSRVINKLNDKKELQYYCDILRSF